MKNDPTHICFEMAQVALSEPDGRDVGPGQAWEFLPNDLGVVFVTGAPDEELERWVVDGTAVTVAELRAAAPRFAEHGLGTYARMSWSGPRFRFVAEAWGATSENAMRHLVRDLTTLWPDVQAAVGDGTVEQRPWEPGEERTTAAGVSLIAAATGVPDALPMLRAQRGYVGVTVTLGLERLFRTLQETVRGLDPRGIVAEFDAWHASRGRQEMDIWTYQRTPLLTLGVVAPHAASRPADRA